MALTICNYLRLARDWKLENLASGKEISTVPFGMEKEGNLCFNITSKCEAVWSSG